MPSLNDLRQLDIDDLIILAMLSRGAKKNAIAAKLGLTPPAITQRLVKFEYKDQPLVVKKNRERVLTERGYQLAEISKTFLWSIDNANRLSKSF